MIPSRAISLVILTMGLAIGIPSSRADDEPAFVKRLQKLTDAPLKPEKDDDEIRKLMKERFNACAVVLQARVQEYLAGRATLDVMEDAMLKLRDAALELHEKPADRIPILEVCLEAAREIEMIAEARFKAGRASIAEREDARRARIDAEIRLLRTKKQGDPSKPR